VPTYQYACTECGHQLEAVQSFSDAALTECPNCQGKLRKVFNSVGIVFKGSGFYRNDSRPKETSEKPSTGAESTTTKKADSAPSGDSSTSSSSTSSSSTSSSSSGSTPSSTTSSSSSSSSSGTKAAATS
jgi:putative FmdB family regulatory protein